MELKYNCLIVDDHYPAHEIIKTFLLQFDNVTFTKSVYNGKEAISEMNVLNKYDIVFLDIDMPLYNGIEVLKNVINKPQVIITTAFTDFAFEAYQHDAVAYLQKPFSKLNFNKAIEKIIPLCELKRHKNQQLLTFKIDGLTKKIIENDILYFKSLGNFSKIYIKNQSQPVLINESFSKLLTVLNTNTFQQIHRTCIVNKNCIAKRNNQDLILNSGDELTIGRTYYTNFK